jgi:DNA polymerase III beta subunit, C-terminal domain/DNA polymerase III beta subunit, central domain
MEIGRVLGAGEEVRLALTDNQFLLEMPSFVMTARLIEGQFPNYEAVIPKAHPGRLTIGRASLAGALRRVAVMADERNKPVKVALAPGTLRLSDVAGQDAPRPKFSPQPRASEQPPDRPPGGCPVSPARRSRTHDLLIGLARQRLRQEVAVEVPWNLQKRPRGVLPRPTLAFRAALYAEFPPKSNSRDAD